MAADVGPHQDIHALYNGHHRWLLGWLHRKVGCWHRSADLAHDTFMRLLAREESLSILEPRAFLTTVAQRVLANQWRRDKLEQAYLEALAHQSPALAPSAEERAILLETLQEIANLLDGLPVPVKRAFLMAQLEGLTQPEIASALRISVTTVKRYLVRAGTQCYFAMPAA
ncbi:sigma-70 family RNA polymerase sigma factor [Cupriavidus sp. YR651]|uniref:sigma-70 family RNA polymerase sigma factor n=1 Tax=Cupriavidus sp. YR651 TaxID=1855315 RepID=UPI000B84DADF|nr:sigma-70 family RNA polymerase sigma factor [Cupriavidus sp. YR651]